MSEPPEESPDAGSAVLLPLLVVVLLAWAAWHVWDVLAHGSADDMEALDRVATDPNGP